MPVEEGALLWRPSEEWTERAAITRYMAWLKEERGLHFASYQDLWEWSVSDLEGFWSSVADFFGVRFRKPWSRVLTSREMPGARWFEGAELNYAEHALARRDDAAAFVFAREDGLRRTMTYAELYRAVARVQAGLEALGVRRGDRVAAYLPNGPEALIAFLATASLGAIWSSCSPDFGVRAVVDRFRQIEPKVLLAVDGYLYGGKAFRRLEEVAEVEKEIPSLEATVVVPYLESNPDLSTLARGLPWGELEADAHEVRFEAVPFDHPLWILYSSGTTGLPKAMVHGHGGILLEHLKALSLHHDIGPGDVFFWFTTTGWMMWNFLISGLLLGASIVMYDGSPGYPDMMALWRLAEETRMTCFGTSAPYILACMKAGIRPAERDLSSLRSLGSTGAPLPPEGFQWVYENVKADLDLGSMSGGTDLCTAFVGACPILPVYAGEIQCRMLGAKVEAFDEEGRAVVNQVGELVLTEPMPSMPVFFWADPDGKRYRESYFEFFPGVWRHGDWVKVTERGTVVIYGRSDSTLKRAGVRMGTSEFYRVVEEMPEVVDSLVVDTGELGKEGKLILFVQAAEGVDFQELALRIREKVRRELSPRHVPDLVLPVPSVPRTLNGKKLEVPIKRILLGAPVEKVVNPGAVTDPEAVRFIAELAKTLDL